MELLRTSRESCNPLGVLGSCACPAMKKNSCRRRPNQRDAAQLEALSQSQAMVANVLFGAGAGLAAAGVALVIWAPNVTVQPMAGGAQVRGTF